MHLHADIEIGLISEAKGGSSYALAQLLEHNYSAVYKYMLGLTLDSQLAADITQDCMVRVIEKFFLYDPEKSALSTWMITIAKNLFIEHCRKNKRKDKFLAFPELETQTDSMNDLIENEEILSAIKNLSLKARVPVLLKHSAGYSYEEIAKILKIPVGTVKSRIFNGLNSLKKELENYER
jgi:RNA polymerase sigma-70 factor (ECF subfamily)